MDEALETRQAARRRTDPIARNHPAALLGEPAQFLRGPDRPRTSIAAAGGKTEDFMEGVNAFLQKRPAKFKGK
jgi:enoyl-CoA hydratase/carnithine racemase